jgi:hypothetical protein
VDLDQPPHLERLAGGLTAELVSAVAGADGDGQGVQTGELDELRRLVGIGEVAEPVETRAVAVFDAAEAADLAFRFASIVHPAAAAGSLSGKAEALDSPQRVVRDMDSTGIPVYGEQGACNGHFESTCYHPLLLFNREDDSGGGWHCRSGSGTGR